VRLDAPVESEPGIGIAPLLDIVFLLLVFFMVTTSFTTAELPLDLADSESATTSQDPIEPLVVEISAEGVPHVDGEALASDALASVIAERAASGEARLVVRADEATPHGAVVGVLDVARREGLTDVAIAVDAPSEARALTRP
jgi:biopolymer transport protein ExbD